MSDVAIEASVWDLEGTCPYYKVHETSPVPPKKVVPVGEMKYPKSKNPKPVYFLLLKLYKKSDNRILSRNFYWLHLSSGDYKLLEPYKKKKIPLKIVSKVFIEGSAYEIQMHVQNTSERPDSKLLSLKHSSTAACHRDVNFDTELLETVNGGTEQEKEVGLFKKIHSCLAGKNDGLSVAEVNGHDVGVAFVLHFSVHASKKEYKGEDTRILPVQYSDNYFSLVPGESMPVRISFEVPPGVTPRVSLRGWNYDGQTIHDAVV